MPLFKPTIFILIILQRNNFLYFLTFPTENNINNIMTVKDLSIETIRQLPDNCTVDDIIKALWI